jgi:hypothetical protein
MLRELIREEVSYAVKKELKTLTEAKAPKQAATKAAPAYVPQRTTPLVTLDEPFTNVGGPLGDLLNETAQSMAGFGEESVEQANPDFASVSPSATNMLVKDYSAILKKSYNFNA